MKPLHALFLMLIFCTFSLSGCRSNKGDLGSEKNPIRFYFVPSVETSVLEESAIAFKKFLEHETQLHFEVSVPTSYIAVVEAFGSNRVEVASLNTFGYYLAHKKYQAEARLTVLRNGEATYRSQIVARADGPIKKLADIKLHKFAFVDPVSVSGYLMPQKLLREQKITPKEIVFAQRHDNVISMVYQKQVDAGATYYSPPYQGEIHDARRLVLAQYPDIEKKVKIIHLTDPLPNDPIVFRKAISEDIKQKIIQASIKFMTTPEGLKAFNKMFSVSGFKITTDAEYEPLLKTLEELSVNVEDALRSAK